MEKINKMRSFRSFDMAVSHSDPLISDWIQYIKDVQREQEKIFENGNEFYIPFLAIPMSVVKTVFTVAEYFDLNSRTKYLSLYLFDKYLSKKFWEVYEKYEDDANNETNMWNQVTDRLSDQTKLRLMSCIQIASKVDSHYKGIGISQALSGLQLMDSMDNDEQHYTPKTIFISELKVFQTLNYKIPPITTLDCFEVLLVALNLQDMPKFYDAAINVLDFTFLQHQNLYCQLQFMAIGSLAKTKEERITFMTMESDMLFLSASIIVCTLYFLGVNDERRTKITEELSSLINIKDEDITIVAKTIFGLIMPDEITTEL